MADKKDDNKEGKVYDITDKLTFAGDPLPLDEEGHIIVDELTDEQREQLTDSAMQGIAALKVILDENKERIQKIAAGATRLSSIIAEATTSLFKNLNADETIEKLRQISEETRPIIEFYGELETLQPYLEEELKKPKYKGKTLDNFMRGDYTAFDLYEEAQDSSTLFAQAFTAARKAKQSTIEKLLPVKTNTLDFALDKINLFAWDFKATGGQIKFNLSHRPDDNAAALFALSFDPNIKTSKELTHFDRRLQSAIDTAMEKGSDTFTLTGLYYAMGNTGRPAAKQLKKIDDSLTKMDGGKILLDNSLEIAAGYNYPHFKYDDRILHFRRVTVEVDGVITDGAIKVLAPPALMEFARQRNQVTTIPLKVLQSPVSKTDNHLKIEDYLLYRITRQKNDLAKLVEKQKKKYLKDRQREIKEAAELVILLPTFYEHAGCANKDATAKKRARETAEAYLNHYQSDEADNYITAFEIDKERITIALPTK